jgi:hypothetical protein
MFAMPQNLRVDEERFMLLSKGFGFGLIRGLEDVLATESSGFSKRLKATSNFKGATRRDTGVKTDSHRARRMRERTAKWRKTKLTGKGSLSDLPAL